MSEMVERVRDALRKECLAVFDSTWSNRDAERFARAAIAAMREPTLRQEARVCRLRLPLRLDQIQAVWSTMIDAALSPDDSPRDLL